MASNITEEYYQKYRETNMFLQEELDSRCLDETFSGSYDDSSSPDGTDQSSEASKKNIVSERNRRKKLNERLFALRAVVPIISKMDKASIVKDAIQYIQELYEQESKLRAEISQLESSNRSNKRIRGEAFDFEQVETFPSRPKKTRNSYTNSTSNPIEVLELRVSDMGEKIIVVSLTCNQRMDTMVKLCEVFESLKIKIITANITSLCGRLLKTVLLEADEEEKDQLKTKIQAAITAQNSADSPFSD